jgi:hypothetical protein
MTWIKRNLFLFTTLVAAFVLGGLGGWYLFAGWKKNAAVEEELGRAQNDLRRLWGAEVFPDEENIAAATAELERLNKSKRELTQFFQPIKYQRLTDREGLSLNTHVGKAISKLSEAAEENLVKLPEGYAFGFGGIITGNTVSSNVDLVSWQIQEVETLCMLLFQSKIYALDKVQRAPVETTATATDDYVSTNVTTNKVTKAPVMPYRITYRTFSKGLAESLNKLKSSPHGFVITSVRIDSPVGQGGTAGISEEELDRIARILDGVRPEVVGQFPNRPPFNFNRGNRGLQGGNQGQFPQQLIPIRPRPVAPPPIPAPNSAANVNAPKTHLEERPVSVTLEIQVVRI